MDVVTDNHTVLDSEFSVTARLGFLGELYRQIDQIDFRDAVIKGMLAYEPVAVPVVAPVFATVPAQPMGVCPDYTSEAEFKRQICEAYRNSNRICVERPTPSVARALAVVAESAYHMVALRRISSPVGSVTYNRYYTTEYRTVSTQESIVVEPVSSLVTTVDYDRHFDIDIDIDHRMFSDPLLKSIVNWVESIASVNYIEHRGESSVLSHIFSLITRFTNITKHQPDYICLPEEVLSCLRREAEACGNTIIGIPVIPVPSTEIFMGLNPNVHRAEMSGYPILTMVPPFISAYTVMNPASFRSNLAVKTRMSINAAGSLNQSVIKFVHKS